jgi:hypothetical protein
MGRPKIVPDNVTVALVDLCKVLRSFQMPVFHTTVIAHFKRLTDGTELGRKFQKKSGDGWDWHEGKLDNWFKRHFLGEHPELATGGQMSIDVARNNWCISDNVKYYFDNVEMQLLRVTYCALFWVVSWRSVVITDMPSCLLVQHKIAYINTNYVPFELTDAHCMLSDKAFKEVLRNLEPKIHIYPDQAWRLFSFDEAKILMNTHETNTTSQHRRCEQIVRDNTPGTTDIGEVLSAKSSCAMSVIGGSHANLDGSPMYCCVASKSVNPHHFTDMPVANICGVNVSGNYSCNDKGSVTEKELQHHLKYLDQLRAHHGQPDAWMVGLMDGVQTHVTVGMLEWFSVNHIDPGLRPPYTSQVVQNEDLVTFWQLRNDKDDGFNATKQAHFAKVYIETGRTSLGFQDAILCLKGAWKASVGDREIQRRAWFNGGCMPFHRVPQYIMEREKQKVLKSLAVKAAKAAPGASAGMEQGDALHWDRLMACVPLKNRFGGSAPVVGAAAGAGAAADEDSEEEDGDDPRHSVRSTGNRASDCFNTHVDRRGHKSKMAEMQRALMKADKGQLKAFYDEIKSDDPEFTFHWEKKDTVDKVKLAIFEYSIKLFNFNVLPSAYPSKLKKEVARQAVERGDVPAAEVAAAPAPPVKFFSFLTDANRIFPRGAKYNHVLSSADAMAEDTVVAVPTLPTVAAPVLGGAPPWSVPAAAGGAMDVEPLSAAEIMAELERRQADTLVMMAEFQRKTASESAQAEKAARARVGTAPCDPVDMAN